MKRLCFILLLLLPFYIFAQSLPDKTPADEWKTLDGKIFSISYPGDWELNESGQMGTTFMLFSPLEGSADTFRENVNLIIQDISAYHLDLDEYTKLSLEQIINGFAGVEIIENTKATSKNPVYQKLVYSAKQGVYFLRFVQYYFVIKNQAFVLTFTSSQDNLDKFKEVGESVLNSFKIK